MKYAIIFFLLLIVAVVLPELVMAQPPTFPGPPPQAPIDGGLTILAAAGGAYAINKLRKRKAE
jgi:hypothetical protein